MFYLSEMSYLWAIYGLFMGGTCQKKAVILHRNLKVSNFMNGLRIIGTAAAYLNYRKAKAEYEALQEQADTILAAVGTYTNLFDHYNKHKGDVLLPDDSWMDEKAKENKIPEDIQVSTVLKVSYMVGKWCNGKVSVVMTNTSDTKSYFISTIKAVCSIEELPVNLFYNVALTNKKASQLNPEARSQKADYILKPGETKEFEFVTGKTQILNADGESEMERVRKIICDAAGKKLITSCPKINIDGVETAFVNFFWSDITEREEELKATNECWFYELPGVLRYCMELPI